MNQLTSKTYNERVNQEFVKLFFHTKTTDPNFHSALISTIVYCFHHSVEGLDDKDKAQIILDDLFYIFSSTISPAPFSLSLFIEENLKDVEEIKGFLTALLYGLYYRDIYLVAHQMQNQRENLELLMFQIIAETVSSGTLQSILSHLPLNKQVSLICYAFRNYREGSYYIVKEFEEIAKDSQETSRTQQSLARLISGLKTKYLNINKLYLLLLDLPNVEVKSIPKLMERLEEYSREQTQIFYNTFIELVPLIVDFPFHILEALEKNNGLATSPLSIVQDKKTAEMHRNQLRVLFGTFLGYRYTLNDFLDFTQLFGLTGDPRPIKFQNKQCNDRSLTAKVIFLHEVFSDAYALTLATKEEIQAAVNFALTVVKHLEALHHNPSIYKTGLDSLVFGMPTGGKLLEDLPALPSVLRGFKLLFTTLDAKLSEQISLKDYPFFIYDQSALELFEKNRLFIEKLNKEFQCSIVHLSSAEILHLAHKIGIENLIATDTSKTFGFGGMRNCVFLLTPILRYLFALGKRTYDQIGAMQESELKSLFQQSVCGGQPEQSIAQQSIANSIFMIDDDMEVPMSNIFSYVLYSKESIGRYSSLHGYIIGRNSRSFIFQNPEALLRLPEYSPNFIVWLEILLNSSLAIYVGKPKICLNIPFGWEEDHSIIPSDPVSLPHPVAHLSGPRFPSGEIPTHFFVGLEKRLKDYVPYCLTSLLSNCLLDPQNHLQRLALPWNEPNRWLTFSGLGDILTYIADDKTKKEMQKRFWRNVNDLFLSPRGQGMEINALIYDLMHNAIDPIINEFQKEMPLSGLETNSLIQIGKCYHFFQQDAHYFWEYGTRVLESILIGLKEMPNREIENPAPWYYACIDRQVNIISIIDSVKDYMEKNYQLKFAAYPLTEALFLLFNSVGAAKFNDAIAMALKK